MIPGPNVSQLAQPTAIGVKVDVVRGREVLALDVPVWDVTLDGNSDRIVSHELIFMAPIDFLPVEPMSPLNNYGQRVHLWSILEIEGIPYQVEQGWFQIRAWSEKDSGVNVTAVDLMQCLEDDQMLWPSSPPKDATLFSELQRLAGNMPISLDCVDRKLSGDMQWGRSRASAIADLCEGQGLEAGIKADGYLHVWEHRNGRVPVASYTSRDLLLSAERSSMDRKPNRVAAVGEKDIETGKGDKKKTEPVKFASTASATLPPYDSAYGIVREVIEVQSATSEAATMDAATRALSDAMNSTGKRPLEIQLDPRLELGDVIALTPPKDSENEANTPFVGRIVAFSKPLDDPKAKMRVDVEVLQW